MARCSVNISTGTTLLLPFFLLTSFMEQWPSWEPNSRLASQEIPRFLWNPKVEYCVYKRARHKTLSWASWLTLYFYKIHSNIVLLSTPRSSKRSFPIRFSNSKCMCLSNLPYTCYISRPYYLLDFTVLTIFDEECTLWNYPLYSFLQAPPSSSLLGPSILLSILLSDILSVSFL
jgi:hypothetical protein